MGEEIALTFETLYDLLMREKQREELLPLEPSFFQDVIHYLREKMRIWEKISQDNDLFSVGERDKVEGELRNIRRVLKDLYERREKKIIDLALNSSRVGRNLDVGSLLPEEHHLIESLMNILDRYRHGVLFNLVKMELPRVEEKKIVVEFEGNGTPTPPREQKPRETMLVRFVHPVPKFVGSDLCVYGPFTEESVASLPKDVARVLIQKKRVEEMRKSD